MVLETYPFPWIELPSDKDLSDDSKNTSIYDWVRAYKLLDLTEKSHANNDVFADNINLLNKNRKIDDGLLFVEIAYTAKQDSYIELELYNKTRKVASVKFDALSGYGHSWYSIKPPKTANSSNFTVLAHLKRKYKALASDSLAIK